MKRKAERNGPCQARRPIVPGSVLIDCGCRGYIYGRTIGGYDDCTCGHSHQSHMEGDPLPDWTGFSDRECGEHRPLGQGGYAYCFDCSEKCSEAAPCVRCEVPQLRARIRVLESQLNRRGDGHAQPD